MNREDVAKLLTTISNHYWQHPAAADRNIDLMVETWTMVLADIPWTPYGENALEWWLKNEKWPPQAAELRARAKSKMTTDRDLAETRALLDRRSVEAEIGREQREQRLAAYQASHPPDSPFAAEQRRKLEQLAREGLIAWSAIDAEIAVRERQYQQRHEAAHAVAAAHAMKQLTATTEDTDA